MTEPDRSHKKMLSLITGIENYLKTKASLNSLTHRYKKLGIFGFK